MPRVKISYGVELDHIPEEVQNLFDSVGEWMHTLSKQSDTIDDLLETKELESCVSLMNKMRQTLGNLDARIADLSNILEGYNNYVKQSGAENELSTPERGPTVDSSSSHALSRSEKSDGSDDEPKT